MKKTLKVILIVFGILFVLLTILVVKDLRVEAQLDEIVASLSESDKVDMDIKTTGEYAKIEKAIKIDYRDFYKLTSKLVKEYGNPVLENCLTASNFEKDGPKFLKTRAELEELKEARQQINGKMLKIVSEKEVNKKIKKYNFDDYDSDIYKEYIKDLSNFIEETVKSDEEFDEDIEVVIEILDLFQKEANHWQVKDGKIYTDNEELGAKFKWLANKICDNCFEEETISQM